MSKYEGKLKSAFTKRLERELPELITLLFASAGAPDRAYVCNKVTSMFEFKHATPDFVSPGLQALTCTRLAVQGHCRYVIWYEHGVEKATYVVHPRKILERQGFSWMIEPEAWCQGFDHRWLAAYVRKVHGL